MDSIQIKNIRSLKDTGKIELSPITLLVGENSSGKSTFLRLFPLIKQSISKRTDGPLLWAGDVDDYVDFGSFVETITNDGSTDMTLSFSFLIGKWQTYLSYRRDRMLKSYCGLRKLMDLISDQTDIQYSITIAQANNHEYISQVEVQLNRSRFEFFLDPHRRRASVRKEIIYVDTEQIAYNSDIRKEQIFHYDTGFAISEIFGYILPPIHKLEDKLMQELFDDISIDKDGFALNQYHDYITLIQIIGQCLCFGLTWEKIKTVLTEQDPRNTDIDQKLISKLVSRLSAFSPEHVQKMLATFKLMFFYSFFSEIEEYLKIYFRQVHYIAPLRATAERYYRLRNLAIDEVDYQGKNLAMFLGGLSEKRMNKFQEWTQEYFGFRVVVEKKGGHLSVKISLSDDMDPVNM